MRLHLKLDELLAIAAVTPGRRQTERMPFKLLLGTCFLKDFFGFDDYH